jgi:hypothetical protein
MSRFPIYWVPQRVGSGDAIRNLEREELARFPIYWVPQRVGRSEASLPDFPLSSFQFIGFPSEWGVSTRVTQLISRAVKRFQFIGFPSEWGEEILVKDPTEWGLFPIYWVPQRVGSWNGQTQEC